MTQSTHPSPVLTLVSSPSLRLIEADLVNRGLNTTTRQLYLFLWRAKTQPKRLPLGLVFGEKALAEELHVSVRTIQRALHALVQQNLLRIQPRVRSNGGTSSNRYLLTWQPLAQVAPTITHAPIALKSPAEAEPTPVPEGPEITPDTVLIWPAVSGDPTTECQEGGIPESASLSAIDTAFSDLIDNTKTFSKSDHPVPQSQILTFNSETALQLFLFTLLNFQNIPSARIHRWIRHYPLERLTQVIVWMLSAPKGVIRSPGGWIEQALLENWTAPLWVRQAREQRLKDAQRILAAQEQTDHEIAEGKKIAENREQADMLWGRLAPRIRQLPDLYAYATRLAQDALQSAFPHVFKPGSVTERAWLIQAAQECPELWQTADALA